jgi:uncharacterized repeat protein (TIGR03803 family)
MPSQKTSIGFILTLAILAMAALAALPASAQTEAVLHSFDNNGVDGYAPSATMIADSAGNFYGTTQSGGAYGYGTVFEVRPEPGGGSVERVLHSFNNNGVDGYTPYGGLVMDSVGNLYGATTAGGANGDGAVFELIPQPGAVWHEKVIYNFGYDGSTYGGPESSLIFDSVGNLYGTTSGGGTYEYGTVFELKPVSGHGWAGKVLYSFNGNAGDGTNPIGGLTFDSAGNLYGTTIAGGAFGDGTVFELSPAGRGNWNETLLYSFGGGTDGDGPLASVILDPAGNIYGTTNSGGAGGWGTVFELSPAGGGGWIETLLYSFVLGGNPVYSTLVRDTAGNLYGTAADGGDATFGAVFELAPASGGGWNYTVLHSFDNNGDGYAPYGGMVRDAAGNFYGTTIYGGAYGGGTVFKLRP